MNVQNCKYIFPRWKHFKFIMRYWNKLPLYVMEVYSKSESVKFSLIESVICLFTDSAGKTNFFAIKSVNFH